MDRRRFLIGLAGLSLIAHPVLAQTAQSQIVQQLRDQGYLNIRSRRTLLGRVRILAERQDGSREIVLNPSTGAILRDYVDRSGTDRDSLGREARDGSGSSGRGRGSDDTDDDDDNSGSGSDDDNSGSGSGDDNSGSGSDDDGSGSGHGGSGSGDDGGGSGNSGSGSGSSGGGGDDGDGGGGGGDDGGGDDSGGGKDD